MFGGHPNFGATQKGVSTQNEGEPQHNSMLKTK